MNMPSPKFNKFKKIIGKGEKKCNGKIVVHKGLGEKQRKEIKTIISACVYSSIWFSFKSGNTFSKQPSGY